MLFKLAKRHHRIVILNEGGDIVYSPPSFMSIPNGFNVWQIGKEQFVTLNMNNIKE